MGTHSTPRSTRRIHRAVLSLLATAILCGAPVGAVAAPEVGQPAPDFSLPGTDGKTHTLAEHRGKRAVVLAWFPKAFTKG